MLNSTYFVKNVMNQYMGHKCSLMRILNSLFFLSLIQYSCDTRIDVEHPQVQPLLVIEATNKPYDGAAQLPSHLKIKVSRLQSLSESYLADSIKNAKVVLSTNLGSDTLIYSMQNYYEVYKPLRAGQRMELLISHPAYPTIYACDTVPSKITPNEILLSPYIGKSNDKQPIGSVHITFEDPREDTNFYEVEVSMNGINYPLESNEPAVINEYYMPKIKELSNYKPVKLLFSDVSFNGEKKSILFQFFPAVGLSPSSVEIYGGLLQIKFRHVSRSYYTYYASLLESNFNRAGDILMGKAEAKNLYSNIENGIGLFGFYNEVLREEYLAKMIIN